MLLSCVGNPITSVLNEHGISVDLINTNPDLSCGVKNFVQGGFYGGTKQSIEKLRLLYINELNLFMLSGTFGGKDQYVLSNILIKHQEDFKCLHKIRF